MTFVVLGIGLGVTGIGMGISGAQNKKSREQAAKDKKAAESKMQQVIEARQDVINPYESTKNLSELAVDLSSGFSNPFNDLSVATQAAEIQVEQSDISLANALDTIRATGASAGGATALAMAALQSKKGVAASIESQEVQNQKLRAQGEQMLQSQKVAEQRRLQTVAISEGQRVQQNEASGKLFEFQVEENRSERDLDRYAGVATQAQAQEIQSQQAQAATYAAGIQAVGTLATAYGQTQQSGG
jgi:hypothetical protein